jgi:predicted nucleic acid-binding protein
MIGHKGTWDLAEILYNYIKENYKIIDADLLLCDKSMEKYRIYEGNLSIADVVALEVMEKYKINEIVSF